jgi:hypothetical protein
MFGKKGPSILDRLSAAEASLSTASRTIQDLAARLEAEISARQEVSNLLHAETEARLTLEADARAMTNVVHALREAVGEEIAPEPVVDATELLDALEPTMVVPASALKRLPESMTIPAQPAECLGEAAAQFEPAEADPGLLGMASRQAEALRESFREIWRQEQEQVVVDILNKAVAAE